MCSLIQPSARGNISVGSDKDTFIHVIRYAKRQYLRQGGTDLAEISLFFQHEQYLLLKYTKNSIPCIHKKIKAGFMNRSDEALEYFRNKFNCSQSVFTVFGKEYGLSENNCLKTGCAFGAGMGRQQLTCGAVTGALMAIGLKYGKAIGDPDEKKQVTYEKTREFFKEFAKNHGSTSCRELLKGLDINDPDDHQKIVDQGLFTELCEKYVTDAVRIVEKL